MAKCRYWLIIYQPSPEQGDNNPYFPVLHQFVREIHWSTGWGGLPKLTNILQQSGPFSTKAELLNFYYGNKANFPGLNNHREVDMATDGNCEDQG